MNGLATGTAPDMRLPLVHILTGVAAALAGGMALIADPRLLRPPLGNQHTLAVTHLFTLGWLAMTIVGASYQLVPVVLETGLRSPRTAWAGYPAFLAGTLLMIAGFWWLRTGVLVAGAALAILALGTYAVHIIVTVGGAPARGPERGFFLAATAYLLLVLVLGGILAANLRWHFLRVDLRPAHIIAVVLGWVTLLAMGVAYRLTPMFALSRGREAGAGRWVLAQGAAGTLILLVPALVGGTGLVRAVCGLPLFAAVALFLRDQWRFVRQRSRPRLDVGLRLTVVACGYLAVTAVVGYLDMARVWRLSPAAPVVLALLGWLGCLVAGQTYKIVPFLVWFRHYADQAGREGVPLLREMYDERLAAGAVWGLAAAALLQAGGAVAGSAWAVRVGALAWTGGYGILATNLVQVLRA